MTDARIDELAGALLAAFDVTTRTTEAIGPTLDRHGLTFNTAYVLWVVDPGQPAPTMKAVAERMHCTPSNLTYLCDQLEVRGLVERVRSTTDRRQRVLRITDAGGVARDAVIAEILRTCPLVALGVEQLRTVRHALERALA